MRLVSLIFSLFILLPYLGAHDLLNKIETLSATNPYQAFCMLNHIDPDGLTQDEKQLYQKLCANLLSFKLPLHKLGLSDSNISALAIDGQDLWIGDKAGSIVRYNLNTAEAYTLRRGRLALAEHSVNDILVQEDTLWFVTSDGILVYNKKTDTLDALSLAVAGVPMAMVHYQNRLLLAIKNAGLYEWSGEQFIVSPLDTKDIHLCQTMASQGGYLAIGTQNGLYFYNGKTWQSVIDLAGQNIIAATAQRNNFWVATPSTVYICATTGCVQQISADNATITAIFALDSRVFIGILNGGLAEIHTNKINKEHFAHVLPLHITIGAFVYHEPYLIIGTLGDAVFFVHNSLF